MALNPSTNPTMAGRVTTADASYPYASSKDETAPGAGDGTPYFKARADDIFGFQQALLSLAGIVPSGNADTVVNSQYAQALVELASGRAFSYDDSGVADAYVLVTKSAQYAPNSLFDGLTVYFSPANTNTGASTVNVAGLGVKSIRNSLGGAMLSGDIVSGARLRLRYDLANGWFVNDDTTIRARIYLGGGVSIPTGLVSATFVSFGQVQFNNGGLVSGGTFTIPSGVTKVKARAYGQFAANATGDRVFVIRKNQGAQTLGYPSISISAAPSASTDAYLETGILDVVAGDTIDFGVAQNSGGNLTLAGTTIGTWFEVEVIK